MIVFREHSVRNVTLGKTKQQQSHRTPLGMRPRAKKSRSNLGFKEHSVRNIAFGKNKKTIKSHSVRNALSARKSRSILGLNEHFARNVSFGKNKKTITSNSSRNAS